MQQTRADQLVVRRRDQIAGAGVRHLVGPDFDGADQIVAAYRQAYPHVVHRLAGATHAGQQRVVVVLDVGQVAFDVEQIVVPPIAFIGDGAYVQARTVDGGG